MFRQITNAGGSKLQIVIGVVVLVVLFVAGFQLTALISRPASQATDTQAASAPTSGGIGVVTPPKPLKDFTLTSKTGDPISLSDLRGRTVVLFFGYTHCPDECPLTMANFTQVKQMLGDQASQVAFVFVSVDGKRDTPAQITSFIDQFDPDFIGMTGGEDQLRAVGAEYGLVFSAENVATPEVSGDQAEAPDEVLDQENYFVQHTSPSFVIDRTGKLRMVAFYGTLPATLANQIRDLLREPVA